MSGRAWSRRIVMALVGGALLAAPVLAEEPEKAEAKKEEKKPATKAAETQPAPDAQPKLPLPPPAPRCEPKSQLDFSTLEDIFGDIGGRFAAGSPGNTRPAAATEAAVEWKVIPQTATKEEEKTSKDKPAR